MPKTPKTPKKPSIEQQYMNSLTELEQKALNISKEHLESSFNLQKSIGFIQFKRTIEKKK